MRDVGPEGRDRAAVCAGSTPLRTVVSCVTEPQPDPRVSGGHARTRSTGRQNFCFQRVLAGGLDALQAAMTSCVPLVPAGAEMQLPLAPIHWLLPR